MQTIFNSANTWKPRRRPHMSNNPPRKQGGLYTALRFTGIPPSWLEKKPKLPSRNWLIFLGTIAAVTSLYVDDRRKCKNIREEYVAKVRHLAEEPLDRLDWGRKVIVYSCRYPEDHEHERSMKYFKKYVKPVLVAAAVDYDIINGNHYGALAAKVAEDIKKKRREALGLEPGHDEVLSRYGNLSGDRSPAAKTRRELQGGTVIVGRHSLKEYMTGLKRGWSESLTQRDTEEELALTLSDDIFDDPAVPASSNENQIDGATGSTSPLLPPSSLSQSSNAPHSLFGPIRQAPTLKTPTFAMSDVPPAVIPQQAPLGLVPYTSHLGFWQVPYMVYDFFTQRHRVLSGCKAGYAIVMAHTRPMTQADLDFDVQSEQYIKAAWNKLPKRIEEAKKDYYKDLQTNIKVARELAYGEREPTRAEKAQPPKTEVELRAQRLKKELKWKEDLEGWDILNGAVAWDDKFDGVVHVFDHGSHIYE